MISSDVIPKMTVLLHENITAYMLFLNKRIIFSSTQRKHIFENEMIILTKELEAFLCFSMPCFAKIGVTSVSYPAVSKVQVLAQI